MLLWPPAVSLSHSSECRTQR